MEKTKKQQPEKCQREKRGTQLAVRFYWEVSDGEGETEESKEAAAFEQRGLGWWRGGGFAPSSPATDRDLGNPGHPHRYPSGSAIKVIA